MNKDYEQIKFFYRKVRASGNGAHIIIPKHLIGQDVMITIVKIKKFKLRRTKE